MASAPAARFEAVREATVQREAKSVDAADKMALSSILTTGSGTATPNEKLGSTIKDDHADGARRGGDHLFAHRNDRWTDVTFKEGMKVVKIKPFTSAYFKLLDAMPELRIPFAVGEKVLVAGRHIAIEVSPEGAEQLGDAELRTLKEQW